MGPTDVMERAKDGPKYRSVQGQTVIYTKATYVMAPRYHLLSPLHCPFLERNKEESSVQPLASQRSYFPTP